tara:strand:+ start:293 stop:451 length:159 start_codon:yes stop_codon:yes gene_type:complete
MAINRDEFINIIDTGLKANKTFFRFLTTQIKHGIKEQELIKQNLTHSIIKKI